MPSAVIFGARNLGKAVIDLLVAEGWAVTGAARSQTTLEGVAATGATAVEADITDPASVRDTIAAAAEVQGGVDLVLNAAAAYGGSRGGHFGGGPILEAGPDDFDSWTAAPAPGALTFLFRAPPVLGEPGPAGAP